jgi:cellulose synthase/poly-beta-1,6-N-acetylglucosamine synthase-like glycosyltransferase
LVSTVLLVASLLLFLCFFVYGFNIYYLTWQSRKESNLSSKTFNCTKPKVSVQLPIYNERYVAPRLLKAVVKMAEHYGKDKVQILVLDDSTDDTTQILGKEVEEFHLQGYNIDLIHRNHRDGFKGGALANALHYTQGEFIAIFDADFIPQKDFLERTIPHMVADPSLGFLQCRWGHANPKYNAITKAAALAIDAFFLVEQTGRQKADCFINFNGSAGVLRKEAVIDAGGWCADTLSEDLDLSYRMQIKGWKYAYLRDLACPAEIPPTIVAFKRQQSRWAQGSIRTARRLVFSLFKKPQLTLKQKIEALLHLTYYFVHFLMFTSYLLALASVFFRAHVIQLPLKVGVIGSSPPLWSAFLVALYLAIAFSTFAVWIMCYIASKEVRMKFVDYLKNIVALTFVGYGISISNTIAVFKGLFSARSGVFQRTPKYKIESPHDLWRNKKYQIHIQKTAILELAAGMLAVASLAYALSNANIGITPILTLYAVAYMTVGLLSIRQSVFKGIEKLLFT